MNGDGHDDDDGDDYLKSHDDHLIGDDDDDDHLNSDDDDDDHFNGYYDDNDHLNGNYDDDDNCLGLPRATHTRLIFLPKANIFL